MPKIIQPPPKYDPEAPNYYNTPYNELPPKAKVVVGKMLKFWIRTVVHRPNAFTGSGYTEEEIAKTIAWVDSFT